MKDYRLTVSVKNNLLLSMMELRGISTAVELSRQSGVNQSDIGDYLRLLVPAYSPSTGRLYPNIARLCKFFKCEPDHIFPEEHLRNPLATNTSSVEVSMDELKNIPGLVDDSPEIGLIESDVHNALAKALDTLTPRQRDVLSMRYGLEDGKTHTHEKIGEKYGVTRATIREVEQKALRLLRNSHKGTGLREALGVEERERRSVHKYKRTAKQEEKKFTEEEVTEFINQLMAQHEDGDEEEQND
jgi:RNA polymerase sigma factor (sigma-70 family)